MFEENKVIDIKSISINERPDIRIQDMEKYKNGGLAVESQESNGILIYVPRGIYYDFFRAIAIGARFIRNEIYDIKELNKNRVLLHKNKELVKDLQEEDKYMVDQLAKYASLLENVETIINDV